VGALVNGEGRQAITSCALIYHVFGDVTRVLVAKRSETKRFLPGFYELPGGHVEFGEDIAVGLRREIREELGVRINVGDPVAAFTYMNTATKTHAVEVIFLATLAEPPERIHVDPRNHSSVRFVDERESLSVQPMTANERNGMMKGLSLLRSEGLQLT